MISCLTAPADKRQNIIIITYIDKNAVGNDTEPRWRV